MSGFSSIVYRVPVVRRFIFGCIADPYGQAVGAKAIKKFEVLFVSPGASYFIKCNRYQYGELISHEWRCPSGGKLSS